MTAATVFQTNRTQAVRLPKAVAFPAGVRRVNVEIVGDKRVLTPAAASWTEWFAMVRGTDPDFLADRDQGVADERDWGSL